LASPRTILIALLVPLLIRIEDVELNTYY